MGQIGELPLLLIDESSAGSFVTAGVVRLPPESRDQAVVALRRAKELRGIAADAKLHCRIIFAGDARRKSKFQKLDTDQVHELLTDCATAMLHVGGSWWGAYVDQSQYPRRLQLIDGEPFDVTIKSGGFGHLCRIDEYRALSWRQLRSSVWCGSNQDRLGPCWTNPSNAFRAHSLKCNHATTSAILVGNGRSRRLCARSITAWPSTAEESKSEVVPRICATGGDQGCRVRVAPSRTRQWYGRRRGEIERTPPRFTVYERVTIRHPCRADHRPS
jgi:hypothetical protein